METRTLYHGSDVIVEHPLVNIGRKDLYFGPGFYLTPIHDQASKWAIRIKTIRKSGNAIVNNYELSFLSGYKTKLFKSYDKEWLDFIVNSRKGKRPWEGYDVIEGGVADDRVIDAVEAYINGYADVEHTLRQLVYHKPNYQICILNQEIADNYLQYKSYERYNHA